MPDNNVLQIALGMAANDLPNYGSTNNDMTRITFADNSSQNLDLFSAKKIVNCYAMLDDDNKKTFERELNSDATSFNKAKDFAVYNTQ